MLVATEQIMEVRNAGMVHGYPYSIVHTVCGLLQGEFDSCPDISCLTFYHRRFRQLSLTFILPKDEDWSTE